MTKSHLILLAILLGLFGWLFADALFGSGVFVFRDAGHYYYRLLEYTSGEWAAGRVPLWNPHENLGVPLAGNATSSVFYPGAAVFLLPLDHATAYTWYVMAHVLLAAGGVYRLGRHWNASVEAAGVAAISYAFSGCVLYQYCNVVFLVGAAWLPFAVLAADRMLVGRSARWAIAFGATLAMMTLGGDPQTAYHAGLMATGYAAWLWWDDRRSHAHRSHAHRSHARRSHARQSVEEAGQSFQRNAAHTLTSVATGLGRNRISLLAIAATVGFVLAAVQVLPSAEFARRGGRRLTSSARTLYEVPSHSDNTTNGHWSDGLLYKNVEPGMHHEHVYHFSVGPWRLVEFLWPNGAGRQFPTHARWLEVVPAEGRIWAPSLYMGVFPFILAFAGMRWRSGSTRAKWLTWTVALSVTAAFGWYGLGWLVLEIRTALGCDPSNAAPFGPPVGGPYWLMTVLLPGYIYFRYPAKLMTVAALALSMLAARGWDRTMNKRPVWLRGVLAGLAGVSLLAAAASLGMEARWNAWLAHTPGDSLFGPFDSAGALADVRFALLQTGIVCATAWWLLGNGASKGTCTTACLQTVLFRAFGSSRQHCLQAGSGTPLCQQVVRMALVALVAVDLGLANGWMIVCAPADQWKKPSTLGAAIQQEELRSGDGQPFRVYRRPVWLPERFKDNRSDARLVESLCWDRDTLWPKHNLPQRISMAEVHGTMMPYDYQAFLWHVRRQATPAEGRVKFGADGLGAISVRWAILHGSSVPSNATRVATDHVETAGPNDVALWRNDDWAPRTWIVHQMDVLRPETDNTLAGLLSRTRRVFQPDGQVRDLRHSAAVETELAAEAFDPGPSVVDQTFSEEECRVVRYEPDRVEIEAQLAQPGLVVLCDQYYPGWRLDVQRLGESRSAPTRTPILRTNRMMRGAWLPAGKYRLVYKYRPASFLVGAVVSMIGWLAAVGIGILAMRATRS